MAPGTPGNLETLEPPLSYTSKSLEIRDLAEVQTASGRYISRGLVRPSRGTLEDAKTDTAKLMLLSRSFRRKVLATVLAALGFVLLYNATVMDSRSVVRKEAAVAKAVAPKAGSRLGFTATAYCKGEMTSAGVTPQAGIAAADPLLLPEGSVVQLDDVPDRYRGIYTVMDTGPKVIGRHVDLYMWSCIEALSFGRRPVTITVLRLGWHPRNTAGF